MCWAKRSGLAPSPPLVATTYSLNKCSGISCTPSNYGGLLAYASSCRASSGKGSITSRLAERGTVFTIGERGFWFEGAGGDISANSLGAVAGMESQMNEEKNKQLMPYVSFWFFEKDKILKENKDRSTSITLLHTLRLHISLHPAPQAASPPI